MAESLQHPREWSLSTWLSAVTLLFTTGVLGAAVWVGAEWSAITGDLKSLDGRVAILETRPMGPEAARRISVLEADQRSSLEAMEHLRKDQTARFDRLERKLDRVIERAIE